MYRPTNILVTGGAGFIASHVAIHLTQAYPDSKIVVVDKLDYCSSLKNLDAVRSRPNFAFYQINIINAKEIARVIAEEKIDTVLHFAAQTHVDNSFGNSFQFTENNVFGTHVMLEVAKKTGIRRFIHVSTDEVYGEIDGDEADEGSVLNPTNPYSATKAGAEFLARAYHKSFQLPVIITRGNNVYGPHQFPEKLIPKFSLLLNQGKKVPIHGDGSEKRSFLHVDDVVRAFDLILRQGVVGETYNIGTANEYTNNEVTDAILSCFGVDAAHRDQHVYYVPNRPFNDVRYTLNSSKLNALGWAPQVRWEEGLRATVSWYREHPDHWEKYEEALVPHPRIGLASRSYFEE